MNERLDGLMSYLNTLARLSEDTYRCNTEIAEAISEIKAELEIGIEKSEKDNTDHTELFYARYIDEIKRIAHEYKPLVTNEELFRTYIEGLPISTIWTDRCSGSTTSAIALSNVVPRVAYIVEHSTIAKDFTTRLNAKNVYSIADIKRGSKLFRDYDVFIFDDVSDRSVLVKPLQAVRDGKCRIIKIRSSDYSVNNDLSDIPTAQLADELAKREGVTEYYVDAHNGVASFIIENGLHKQTESFVGPARIIVNKD